MNDRAVTTPPGSRDEQGHIFGTRLVCIRCGAVIDSDEASKSTCETRAALRMKSERPVVYPLNRDECLSRIEAGEELVAALEGILEHAKQRDRFIPMTGTIAACEAALSPRERWCVCCTPPQRFPHPVETRRP